jgi:2-polyprenyl-3-methyl-5-hydroxy-6-metoxy-1,4-benzoquinol methylase
MSRDRQVAEYWNSMAAEFDAIYTGANKSALGRLLDRTLRRDMYDRFEWVLQRSGAAQGKSICDIGCGSGRFVAALARRGAARVVGVDVAPEMIKLAEQLVSREGVSDRCEFVVRDVLAWDTPETFDVTIAVGFWDYIQSPAARLRRIRALTTGVFLSAWPRLWTWRAPIRKARLAVAGCPVYFYRRRDVAALLHAADFEIGRIDVVGKLYCVEAYPRGR